MNTHIQTLIVLLGSLATVPAIARAQATRTGGDTVVAAALRPVTVTVTRDRAQSPFSVPFAISTVVPDTLRPGQRRQSVGDLLFGIPGLMVQERSNPSQDPRLAIRGFGARSAFGVRGVRVLRDGIPLSLPDGQTPIDWLELESVGRVDVIRGTAAALYGNAAGGVVEFRSMDPLPASLTARARWWNDGSAVRTTATVSGRQGDRDPTTSTGRLHVSGAGGSITGTRTTGDGMRQWSAIDASHLFARTFATVGSARVEVQGTHYQSDRAENTGALTASELSRDPLLPDSLNITRRSRKAVTHRQLALLVDQGGDRASVSFAAFASTRALDNPLAFAIVAVDRAVSGASLRASARTTALPWPTRFTVGADAQRQDDSRLNYENCADFTGATATTKCPSVGMERGARRLDQRELVRGVGSYARAEVQAPHNVLLSAAARYDRVDFRVTDRFITSTNADDSGTQLLSATTPMVGIVWRVRPTVSVFGNWTSAFETPTITELTNQDDGSAGLNARLLPQRTRTVESGVQAIVASRVRVDAALFRAGVQDELVPFDVPNAPGRRAFRNAGQSTRTGMEAAVLAVLPVADVGVSYTRSHFRFDRYTVGTADYSGNVIPGVPAHQAQMWSTVRHRGWFGTLESRMASRVTANDAGTVFASGYAVWSARAGWTPSTVRHRLAIMPTVGVDNLFDRRFAGSVVVNATRGRFYEPGLPRRVFLSVSVSGR